MKCLFIAGMLFINSPEDSVYINVSQITAIQDNGRHVDILTSRYGIRRRVSHTTSAQVVAETQACEQKLIQDIVGEVEQPAILDEMLNREWNPSKWAMPTPVSTKDR